MKTPGPLLSPAGKGESSSCLSKRQCAVLKMAWDRLSEKDDLSYAEIAVSLFGCRPDRIGARRVRTLSLKDLVNICRLAPHETFHFSLPGREKSLLAVMDGVSRLVEGLVEKGLLEIVPAGKLVWAKGEPRVERIEYGRMIRLTEKGKSLTACLVWPNP